MQRLTTCLATLACLTFAACTPKTTDSTAKTPTKQAPSRTASAPAANEKLSSCPKFTDAPNPGRVEDDYVIYRDYLRSGQTDKAYALWQKVYAVAPAADGRRNTVITDGIYFAEYYASQEQDPAKRGPFVDQVFAYYDKISECYPEGGYVPARKAFDYFYKYPDRATKPEQYTLFKEAIAIDGDTVPDFIINPLASLVVDLYEAKEIDQAEAKEMELFIQDRIRKGVGAAKTPEGKERWAIIEGYAPERLAFFETVQGFYDCQYFKDKFLADGQGESTDCGTIAQTAGYLKFGGCPADDPAYAQLVSTFNSTCKETTTGSGRGSGAYAKLQDGDYQGAVTSFEQMYSDAEDADRRSKVAMVLAKVYYGNLRQYSTARKWARQAAADRPNWGEPYLLIGKLYASSGPLCGPGTGFDSQVVVWPAIDQWTRAKSVDASAAAEANKLIGQYRQYMPSKGDLFSRGMAAGSTYSVGCWIGESTTVRAAP